MSDTSDPVKLKIADLQARGLVRRGTKRVLLVLVERLREPLQQGRDLEERVEECKSCLKNIRDKYMKRKRNKRLPTGSALGHKPRKWHLENHLALIDQVQTERLTVTNTQAYEEPGGDCGHENSQQQTENVEIATQGNAENEATLQESENLNDEGLPNRKRKHLSRKNATDSCIGLLEKDSQDRQELLQALGKLEEQEHPIDIFFRSMAASVKTLSADRQIRAKMQVSQIIGQLELEEISSQSLLSHCHDTTRPTSWCSSYSSDDSSLI